MWHVSMIKWQVLQDDKLRLVALYSLRYQVFLSVTFHIHTYFFLLYIWSCSTYAIEQSLRCKVFLLVTFHIHTYCLPLYIWSFSTYVIKLYSLRYQVFLLVTFHIHSSRFFFVYMVFLILQIYLWSFFMYVIALYSLRCRFVDWRYSPFEGE